MQLNPSKVGGSKRFTSPYDTETRKISNKEKKKRSGSRQANRSNLATQPMMDDLQNHHYRTNILASAAASNETANELIYDPTK